MSPILSDMLCAVQEVHLGDCQRLRVCYVSGEALPPSTVQKFAQRLPRAQLHNLYGPTEATVDVTGVYWSFHQVRVAQMMIGNPDCFSSWQIICTLSKLTCNSDSAALDLSADDERFV